VNPPRGDSRLGKYTILEELGSGGFGTVYKAVDTTLDRVVALKVLHPQLLVDPDAVRRFQREAKTAASLDHPNIVQIYEVGETENRHYIAMRFLEGSPLNQVIQDEGPLALDLTMPILRQVGEALDYAHAKGVLHRDVKPSNIIVDDAGHATLTDFGLARAATESSIITLTGKTVGTVAYAAPEQVDEERLPTVDARTDLYSLGVVAYEMLTGKPPFGGTITTIIAGHLTKEPEQASSRNPALPKRVDGVLGKALAKAQEARFISAAEFAAALDKHVVTDKGHGAPGPEPHESHRRLPRALVAIAALAIFGLTGFGIAKLTSGDRAAHPPEASATVTLAPTAGVTARPEAPISTPTRTPQPAAAPVATPQPVGPEVQVQFVVTGRSWVQMLADGEVVYAGLLEDEAREWTAAHSIVARVGNAGAVAATVNGQSLGVLGTEGEVFVEEWTADWVPPAPPGTVTAPSYASSSVDIVWPDEEALLTGIVKLLGTVAIADFWFYKVEIGIGRDPTAWTIIGDLHYTPVSSGVLETFDTMAFPPGQYTIRLLAVDTTGNFPPPCVVRVTLAQ
jgi:serine/threonine protein kinase